MMKKKSLVIGAVSSLVLAGGIVIGTGAQANSTTEHGQDDLAKMNIKLDRASAPAKVDQETAIKNAKKAFGKANDAKDVKVEYHLVTNPTTMLPPEVLSNHPEFKTQGIKKLPAYIISFKGLEIPSRAPKGINPQHATELNVIVDAETGVPIMAFSYR